MLTKHRPGVLRPGQESRKPTSHLNALLVCSCCFSFSLPFLLCLCLSLSSSVCSSFPLSLSNLELYLALALSLLASSLVLCPLPCHWCLASHLPPVCPDSSHRPVGLPLTVPQ